LILVLGVLAVVGVMAAHVALVSETTAREAAVAATRSELRYACESAIDRAFWLLLVDRAVYRNRDLGRLPTERETAEEEVWMTDGRRHEFKVMDLTVHVAHCDADAGLDFSAPDAAQKLRTVLLSEQEERQEQIDSFLDILSDYVDTDDLEHLNGKEQPDYAAEGLPDLPRNGVIQFREEVYWLEGVRETLSGADPLETPSKAAPLDDRAVRLIPPKGFGFQQASRGRRSSASARPSFFSSPPSLIRQLANLTDSELTSVLEARGRWQTEGEPLEDNLDPGLVARLRGRFSFQESGVTTIVATAFSPTREIRRTVRVTRDCRASQNVFADAARERFAYWEKIVF